MPSDFSRRDFLKWMSAGAGAAATGGAVWLAGRNQPPPATATAAASPRSSAPDGSARPGLRSSAPMTAGDPAGRVLVVIELSGGNDGLSTLVPYGLPGYYDLRSATAVAESDLVVLDDEVGLHGALGRLAARGVAVVQGVGSWSPDGSHFEMMRRWWSGDNDGTAGYPTGFLGRLADAVGDPAAPAVALTIGSGNHPALISASAPTLALPNASASGYLVGADPEDVMRATFQGSLARFVETDADGWLGRVRRVGRQTISFADRIDGIAEPTEGDELEYPGSNLGQALRLTAALVAADTGVRIVHVPMGADFDTHENHAGRHPTLLGDLDAAVDVFLGDLERRGLADRVLVMTTSEFGRRARDNGSGGLDHGTASMAMLLGPVNAGRYGAHPSLTELDGDDNLVATVGLDSYYATVAEGWFGVPAGELFASPPEVLGGLFG